MDIKTSAVIMLFAVILTIVWLSFRQKDKKDSTGIQEYDKVAATVNRTYESGRGYRRSTLVNVSYTYNGIQRKTTVRRNGYREGVYNAGDTITVFINPANPEDIK